jgi:hypothetical protein
MEEEKMLIAGNYSGRRPDSREDAQKVQEK